MKITNASASLIDQSEIEITRTDVRIGTNPKAQTAAGVIVLFIALGFFVPGPWYVYWCVGFVLGIITGIVTKDTRVRYTADQIETVSVLGTDRVGTKGAGGSLGGAAVGGLVFGGAGAIVGSIAGGNKIEEFKNICIMFTDGEWVVVSATNGFVNDIGYTHLIKMAGSNNQCPVARKPEVLVSEPAPVVRKTRAPRKPKAVPTGVSMLAVLPESCCDHNRQLGNRFCTECGTQLVA
jgi:hypothetical protein